MYPYEYSPLVEILKSLPEDVQARIQKQFMLLPTDNERMYDMEIIEYDQFLAQLSNKLYIKYKGESE